MCVNNLPGLHSTARGGRDSNPKVCDVFSATGLVCRNGSTSSGGYFCCELATGHNAMRAMPPTVINTFTLPTTVSGLVGQSVSLQCLFTGRSDSNTYSERSFSTLLRTRHYITVVRVVHTAELASTEHVTSRGSVCYLNVGLYMCFCTTTQNKKLS